jgi:hypothetical protein
MDSFEFHTRVPSFISLSLSYHFISLNWWHWCQYSVYLYLYGNQRWIQHMDFNHYLYGRFQIFLNKNVTPYGLSLITNTTHACELHALSTRRSEAPLKVGRQKNNLCIFIFLSYRKFILSRGVHFGCYGWNQIMYKPPNAP